jgi:spoIIIJ-associated protein
MVDVGGYREQAREAIVKRAKEAADKVRRWGDAVELEPLNAFDRRIVHQALKDDPDVETTASRWKERTKKPSCSVPGIDRAYWSIIFN